jgi:hypothetical protein
VLGVCRSRLCQCEERVPTAVQLHLDAAERVLALLVHVNKLSLHVENVNNSDNNEQEN